MELPHLNLLSAFNIFAQPFRAKDFPQRVPCGNLIEANLNAYNAYLELLPIPAKHTLEWFSCLVLPPLNSWME